MKPKYRVEAFIVPKSAKEELCCGNEIDDVKAANKSKLVESASPEQSDESSSIYETVDNDDDDDNHKFKLTKNKKDEEMDEPIYDVPYAVPKELPKVGKIYKMKTTRWCEEEAALPVAKLPRARTSSLVSIDERGETDGILEEFCFHGYKHGCTATAQRPEEVSEEIFKENWLRRLSSVRERESVLRDKEVLLQERERLLFKKERELRILERLVKDKLRQADLHLKRCKSSQSVVESGSSNFDVKTRSCSEGSRDSSSRASGNSIPAKQQNYVQKCQERAPNSSGQLNIADHQRYNCEDVKSRLALNALEMKQSIASLAGYAGYTPSCEEKTTKNINHPANSRSSSGSSSSLTVHERLSAKAQPVAKFPGEDYCSSSNLMPVRNSFAGFGAYNSLRCKPKPKISYDDLDSTLSADVGDSSFVVTSGKFNPAIFKKPYAFTRSSSERRGIRTDREETINSGYRHETHSQEIRGNTKEQDKVLKRLSENIHNSQEKSTKYLNYGLIDPSVYGRNEVAAKPGYPPCWNLERTGDEKNSTKNSTSGRVNERPISWNEESNEWLQKKRHAYNLATKRIPPNDNFENKENLDAGVKHGDNTSDKCTKKKVPKTRKFGIFR